MDVSPEKDKKTIAKHHKPEYFKQGRKDVKLFVDSQKIIIKKQKSKREIRVLPNFSWDIQNRQNRQFLLLNCPTRFAFQSDENLQQWGEYLKKFMRRFKFHQLFTAKNKIGRGSFAEITLVSRNCDSKLFAVKGFLKPKEKKCEREMRGIENEQSVLRKMDHKNIVGLQGVYETVNSLYFVMEYIDGQNIYEYMVRNKDIVNLQMRKTIMKGILEGLCYLDENHIVHRDIKPNNIMIGNDNSIKIIDFGLATDIRQKQHVYIRCGTPGYIAPEIFDLKKDGEGEQKLQTIGDVFCAGIIMYELIYKKQVFRARGSQSMKEILQKNRQCEIIFGSNPSLMQADVDQEHQIKLLKMMLKKNPQDRISAKDALKSPYFSQRVEEIKQEEKEKLCGQKNKMISMQ